MVPIHLRISGFLSYRDPVELDFQSFDLACISGRNGAGKSSLLDAITWALFGKARKTDESIINLALVQKRESAAEVRLTFEYEQNQYRVQRVLPAPSIKTDSKTGKTSVTRKSVILEFHLFDPASHEWKPLTEKTTRETQDCIEDILRLDYETFVNASFFLQGKADQFTQQSPGKRKEILGSILGLDIWDAYKDRTAAKRKTLENRVSEIDGRITEIDTERSEEAPRRARLAELEAGLERLVSARVGQESFLASIKKVVASLDDARQLALTHSTSLESSRENLLNLQARLIDKEAERSKLSDLITRTSQIQTAYKSWEKNRLELEEWDRIAAHFLEQERERAPWLQQIAAEKARLEEQQRSLKVEEKEIEDQRASIENLESEIARARAALIEIEIKINERLELEIKMNAAREKQTGFKLENERLKTEMDELKNRIERLRIAEGAICPLCGQSLSPEHRLATLDGLELDGRARAGRYRTNQIEMKLIMEELASHELHFMRLATAEEQRLSHSKFISQLSERLDASRARIQGWDSTGRKRLGEITRILDGDKFALEARKILAKLDKSLAKLGYDTAAHEAQRQAELKQRSAQEDFNNLNSAIQINTLINDEISHLNAEIRSRSSEISRLESKYQSAKKTLESLEAQVPNIEQAEHELLILREQENQARDEVGAARQKVEILKTLNSRKVEYSSQREQYQLQIAHYKTLERAFGKDGVPALLIEQALPQIESKANELLDRLSDGQMSVRFITQAGYRDKNRDDLKETLEIQISDSAGARDYEMFSGGEAFRVNFAIRLALSEILARRKGARLQTLVIDEGFGSQDVQGRQRLIEAINLIRPDFAKILVITHLDELKDAFPCRIEVEKTERGSTVTIL